MAWSFMEAASEFKQMGDRRIVTEMDAKLLLLRARMILENLTPAAQFELDLMYKKFVKGAK